MNMDELTIGELRDLQLALGVKAKDFATIQEDDPFGLTIGMAWIIERRNNRKLTFKQVCDMTPTQVQAIVEGPADPKAA